MFISVLFSHITYDFGFGRRTGVGYQLDLTISLKTIQKLLNVNLILSTFREARCFYNVYSNNCTAVPYKNIQNHTANFLHISAPFGHHHGGYCFRIPPWWWP